jgi:uncharacterized membrane protein YwzB
VSTRQVLLAAVVLGMVCAAVVWWLESFNRERLIADFHAQLAKLPTFEKGPDA